MAEIGLSVNLVANSTSGEEFFHDYYEIISDLGGKPL